MGNFLIFFLVFLSDTLAKMPQNIFAYLSILDYSASFSIFQKKQLLWLRPGGPPPFTSVTYRCVFCWRLPLSIYQTPRFKLLIFLIFQLSIFLFLLSIFLFLLSIFLFLLTFFLFMHFWLSVYFPSLFGWSTLTSSTQSK